MFALSTRNFAIVLLAAFAATFLFCAWSINAMAMDEPMDDCTTQQSQIALCNANPQGHLLTWQNFLPVTPQKVLAFLLSALLLAIGFSIGRRWLDSPPIITQYLNARVRERLLIVDPIRRALSRGIIQPQIYECA